MLYCYVIGMTPLFVLETHRPPPFNFTESFILSAQMMKKPSMFTCESAMFSLNQVSVRHIRQAERNTVAHLTFAQNYSIIYIHIYLLTTTEEGHRYA